MFINENTANVYLKEVTTEPSYMYEAILEANEAYHELCMKMIKCEHAAIVNENAAMLAEAEEAFKEKKTGIFKRLIDKFRAFCMKVYEEFMYIIGKVAKSMSAREKSYGQKVMIDGEGFAKASQDIRKIENFLKNNSFNALTSKYKTDEVISNLTTPGGKKEITIQGNEYNQAVSYIDHVKIVTKLIKGLINETKTVNADKLQDESVSSVISMYTKAINNVRSWIPTATRILLASASIKTGMANAKANIEAKKAAKSTAAETPVKKESASILDMF